VGCGCTCGGGGEMRWWLQAAAERRRWETRESGGGLGRTHGWAFLFIALQGICGPSHDLIVPSFFLDLSSVFCYSVILFGL
jgi:hypothetical protein